MKVARKITDEQRDAQISNTTAPVMCKHTNFAAQVNVHRMSEKTGGPITAYAADVTVRCADCGLPFQFYGLQPGLDMQGARCSVDGLEARLAIGPKGAQPNPLQRMTLNINKFDG